MAGFCQIHRSCHSHREHFLLCKHCRVMAAVILLSAIVEVVLCCKISAQSMKNLREGLHPPPVRARLKFLLSPPPICENPGCAPACVQLHRSSTFSQTHILQSHTGSGSGRYAVSFLVRISGQAMESGSTPTVDFSFRHDSLPVTFRR